MARLGSDEFAVGLFDIGQHFEASTVAQKLRPRWKRRSSSTAMNCGWARSIGISVFPQDGSDAETLLRLADIAMYRAKQSGGTTSDSVAFYCHEMNQGMQERMRIETGLRHALGNGQLLLHYQPKFELHERAHHRRRGAGALAAIRSAAWCRRPNSSRWPRRPG